MTDYAEEREAIVAALDGYAHASGTRVLPLLAVVQTLVADWDRLRTKEREEQEQWAADDAAEAEYDEFCKTASPEQIDAMLVSHGIDPEDTRRTAAQFARFMPIMMKARDRASLAESELVNLRAEIELLRFGARALARKRLAEEAKRVQLGITAARAAGFPLGELEECTMAVAEASSED